MSSIRPPKVVINTATKSGTTYGTIHAPVTTDILKGMADSPCQNVGDACFDSAYPARDICDIVSKMGGTPYIKPKRSTAAK